MKNMISFWLHCETKKHLLKQESLLIPTEYPKKVIQYVAFFLVHFIILKKTGYETTSDSMKLHQKLYETTSDINKNAPAIMHEIGIVDATSSYI